MTCLCMGPCAVCGVCICRCRCRIIPAYMAVPFGHYDLPMNPLFTGAQAPYFTSETITLGWPSGRYMIGADIGIPDPLIDGPNVRP